jgi:tRNA A37 threonylcarbamoyladenosine modification protein TsaB
VTGPGSFTGLRLAVSTANALGCVWQVPVIPVTAFEIYEQAHPEIKPPYQVILDNIKNLVYVKKVKTGQENYAVEEFRIQNSAGRIGGMIGCLGREKLALARRTGFHSEQIAGEKRARLISAVAEKRIKNVKRFVRPLTPLYINPPKITVRK